jgi:hypothetical protein
LIPKPSPTSAVAVLAEDELPLLGIGPDGSRDAIGELPLADRLWCQ